MLFPVLPALASVLIPRQYYSPEYYLPSMLHVPLVIQRHKAAGLFHTVNNVILPHQIKLPVRKQLLKVVRHQLPTNIDSAHRSAPAIESPSKLTVGCSSTGSDHLVAGLRACSYIQSLRQPCTPAASRSRDILYNHVSLATSTSSCDAPGLLSGAFASCCCESFSSTAWSDEHWQQMG